MGSAVVACAGGGLWYRCARSRGKIVDQLVDDARPVLDKYALSEQEQYPAAAAEKIRVYFDHICLNTAEFVEEINAPEFRRKLNKIRGADKRHQELLTVFCRRVPGANLIGEQVRTIIADIGPKLDQDWTQCCKEIATRWEFWFRRENQPAWNAAEFSKRVTPLVELQVEQAAKHAHRITDEPEWREQLRSVGTAALESGEDVSFEIGGRAVRIPEFVVIASRRVFGKVLELLGDPKWDCQNAMTERFAALGKQTASDFEKDLRRKLNNLHSWREQAVRTAAEQHAADRIGYFGDRG
jgi:hypothetical protein